MDHAIPYGDGELVRISTRNPNTSLEILYVFLGIHMGDNKCSILAETGYQKNDEMLGGLGGIVFEGGFIVGEPKPNRWGPEVDGTAQ